MFTIPNNIHFIWIGSPEKLKNHLTPNCLFQWKKYAEQYSFTLWLDSRYTEKKHDEENLRLYFKGHNFQINIINIATHFKIKNNSQFDFYETCVRTNNPAIAKDIITPYILVEQGGFQYDVTMIPLNTFPKDIQSKHGFLIELNKQTLILRRIGAAPNCRFLMKLIELHNFTSQLVTMTELQYNREQFLKASLLKQVIASKYQRYNYPPSKINEICNDGLDFVEEYISESKVIINKKPVLGAIFFNPDHITLLKRVIAEFITGKVVTELIIAHIKKSTDPSSTSALNMLPQKQLDEIAIPFLDKCLASAERKNLCLAGKPTHLRSTEELYQNTLKLRSLNCTAFTLDQLTQYLFFSRIQKEISWITLPLSGTGRTVVNSLFFFAKNTKPTIEEIPQREMRWQIERLLPLGH